MPVNIGLIKAAARAWKLHDLSDESRSRLEQAGVLDYHKELNGLDRGSDNIFKKVNERLQAMHPDARLKEIYKPGTSDGYTALKGVKVDILDSNDRFKAAPNLEIVYGDKTDYKHLKSYNYATRHLVDSAERNQHPLHNYFERALTRRHELNEASLITGRTKKVIDTGRNRINYEKAINSFWEGLDNADKKTHIESLVDQRGFTGKEDIYSHASPHVLIRESGDLAGAPKSTRDVFTAMRFKNDRSRYRNLRASDIALETAKAGGSYADAVADMDIRHRDLITEGKLMRSSGLNYGTQARASQHKVIGNKMLTSLSNITEDYRAKLLPKIYRFEHLYNFVRRR